MVIPDRILIVDDDVILGESMLGILESEGYNVELVNNGKAAETKIQSQFYNLILLDIRLPDITGLELLSIINQNSPRTRKIMLTGFPDTNTAIRAVNEKADAYLVKPFKTEKLIKVIKDNLELQKEDLKYTHKKVIEFIKNRVKELDRENEKIFEDFI
jgi:two-component system response regulator HydG